VLKVDRAFVADACTEQGAILTRAIVDIGKGLNLQVIAEGIERPDQLRLMRSYGCEYGQGYLFSTPMDATDVLRMLCGKTPQLDASGQADRLTVGAVA